LALPFVQALTAQLRARLPWKLVWLRRSARQRKWRSGSFSWNGFVGFAGKQSQSFIFLILLKDSPVNVTKALLFYIHASLFSTVEDSTGLHPLDGH
jgi:hypothetical protein